MKDWLKKNWFQMLLLLLAVIAVTVWEMIQWKYYELERYQTEQSAINWAVVDQHAPNIVGTREGQAFKKDFWNLFAH